MAKVREMLLSSCGIEDDVCSIYKISLVECMRCVSRIWRVFSRHRGGAAGAMRDQSETKNRRPRRRSSLLEHLKGNFWNSLFFQVLGDRAILNEMKYIKGNSNVQKYLKVSWKIRDLSPPPLSICKTMCVIDKAVLIQCLN